MQHIRALFKNEPYEKRDESVPDIIRESLRFVHEDPNKREVRIDWSIEGSLPPICVDRIQIQQVFINLILNAIEATEGSANTTRILLRAFVTQEHEVTVQVIDNGTGLKDTEKIFDVFMTTKERAWALAWPSQNLSSRPTAGGSGQRTIQIAAAPLSMSPWPCPQNARSIKSVLKDLKS
jgi:hypothetical protein